MKALKTAVKNAVKRVAKPLAEPVTRPVPKPLYKPAPDSGSRSVAAVTFDVGNTLFPFRRKEMDDLVQGFLAFARSRLGPFDEAAVAARYQEVRTEQYRVNLPQLRENDLVDRLRLTLEKALETRTAGGAPAGNNVAAGDSPIGLSGPAGPTGLTPEFLGEAVEAYLHALVAALPLPEGLPALLGRLRTRYRLGIITNYPYSPGTRMLLKEKGIDGFFDAVVVSADWEFVKPHPLLFRQAARELGVDISALLHVGDDWEADIVGAAAAGAQSVLYLGLREEPDPTRGDARGRPLATIKSLEALPALLGLGAA